MKQLGLSAVLKKILKEYWWESSSSLEIIFHPKMILPTPSGPWHLSLFCSTALLLSFSLTSKVKHLFIHCEQGFPASTNNRRVYPKYFNTGRISPWKRRKKCFLTQVQLGLCTKDTNWVIRGLQCYGWQKQPSYRMVYFCVLKHCLSYLCLISRTAVCPEDDQLTALSSVKKQEKKWKRKQYLPLKGPLSSAIHVSTKYPINNKLAERRKGKKPNRQQVTAAT